MQLTENEINKWQEFIFSVGNSMVDAFNVEMTKKLHRTMRYVKEDLLLHDCIRSGATEENE